MKSTRFCRKELYTKWIIHHYLFTKLNEKCCSVGLLFGNIRGSKGEHTVSIKSTKSNENKETSESSDKKVEEIIESEIQMIP